MIFSAFFAFNSFAEARLFVGVSPSIVDLGEVERGTTNLVKFFVVTTSEEPFLVYLQPENGRLEFFNFNYKNFIINYSEENTDKWIKFLTNPIELKPQNETLKTSYETIKGWREVDFLLEIPKDAEPGYHLVKINPVPSSPSTNIGGVGANLVALTSVNIFFKIKGDGIREGIILDTVPGEYISNDLDIDTYFQNIGTTTISAKAIQKIYDKDGNFITEISSPTNYIKPKEIRILESFLPITGLSFGDYKIFTSVSYTTDTAYKNSTISITPEVLIEKPKAEEFPVWIFIFIIIVFAFIIYRWVH
jgi:hypothetical protein